MSGIGKIGSSIRRELIGLQKGVQGYFKDARARNSNKTPATNQASSPQPSSQQSNSSSEPSGSVATGLSGYPSQRAIAADSASDGATGFSHSQYEQEVEASFVQPSEASGADQNKLAQKVVLAELDKVIKNAQDEIEQAEKAQVAITEEWFDDHALNLVNSISNNSDKEQVLDYLKDEDPSFLQKVLDAAVKESQNEKENGDVEIANLLLEFSEDVRKRL